jgi:hypothetical protein
MQPESEYEALMRSDEELDQIMSEVQAAGVQETLATSDMVVEMVPQPEAQEEQAQHQGPDENEGDQLSRTAKQLLESVSHETSDKFAQSSFLELMRRLRDKEVHVEGEDFIEACATGCDGKTNNGSRRRTILPIRRAWLASPSKTLRA